MRVIRRMKVLGYAKVKVLFRDGTYQDFGQIADDIGRAILSKDLGMNIQTLRRRTNDPGMWTIKELSKFSDLMELDHKIFLEMADKLSMQNELREATKKKKGRK